MNAKRLKTDDDGTSGESNAETQFIYLSGCDKFLKIEYDLSKKLKALKFNPPIEYVYDPLEYAEELHSNFVKKYVTTTEKRIMFLGMNPGPWGMCQTGIPFGESKIVREWFQVKGSVNHPENEHPARKISGLDCHRTEVSGKKFWGLFRDICVIPENFFRHTLVYNICPLAFFTESGKNITPAEIKANDRKQLIKLCDEAFIEIVKQFNIKIVVGIGRFAENRALLTLKKNNMNKVQVGSIPHPSPRNAKDFSNWEASTVSKLRELDIFQYFTVISEN